MKLAYYGLKIGTDDTNLDKILQSTMFPIGTNYTSYF